MELFCLFVIASIILKCISSNIAFAVKKMCIGFHKIVSLDRDYQLQLPRMSQCLRHRADTSKTSETNQRSY